MEIQLFVYIGCRCVNKPPPYSCCIQTNISRVYFNLIVVQTATRELTGRTVKKTADIARTRNFVMLRMEIVPAAVKRGTRQIFAKHT